MPRLVSPQPAEPGPPRRTPSNSRSRRPCGIPSLRQTRTRPRGLWRAKHSDPCAQPAARRGQSCARPNTVSPPAVPQPPAPSSTAKRTHAWRQGPGSPHSRALPGYPPTSMTSSSSRPPRPWGSWRGRRPGSFSGRSPWSSPTSARRPSTSPCWHRTAQASASPSSCPSRSLMLQLLLWRPLGSSCARDEVSPPSPARPWPSPPPLSHLAGPSPWPWPSSGAASRSSRGPARRPA
mmetsp:Transcript_38412/g.96409  ORF Transcript_38412/g.96409 Transcript_38412/m.96409 type:complete len:235 (+) Transcript_38412:936-1640(+)